MKIGILSDTHNNEHNTRLALDLMRLHQVERLIHCGDITAPHIVALFEGWQVDFLRGNVDANLEELQEAVASLGNATYGHKLALELDGVRLAATHGHDQALLHELIRSGNYRYVFHGHSHRRRNELIDGTHVINPGALGGLRPQTRSACVLDLETGEAEFVKLLA